ncbi:hypothetical protein MUS1_14840 [Marinomonas ushuaiensis DSM 15871]|uniref:Bacterial transcription activator effector binding domain-containing protein n=1 Tax=Marinomonas ushuaiensis DSM 15871 TaxID=1122207 RepID=X7E374_9GAMM|nr:hypothetical protein [Marinomonas ushuaiensis]ETX10504.1 hypothetical protein MUS1_14840 [Marinomonas ushuaiensis DSM 15871]
MVVMLSLITLFSVLLISYLFLSNGRFSNRYNRSIELPIQLVADDLADLTNWANWLPWLIYDTDSKVTYEYLNSGVLSVVPSCLSWHGPLIRDGYMTLEPARSSAQYFHTTLEAMAFYPGDTHFNIDLTKQKERTLITIQITGNLPFFKRWLRTDYTMRASKDVELALLKLLAHLEKYKEINNNEEDTPVFEWLGQTRLRNIDAVTRPFVVSNQPMSQKMDQGFHDLVTELGPENPPAGPCFALYKKVDLAHHYFSGRLGVPVQNIVPCVLCPERIVLHGNYLHLRYVGCYQNLSLAWHVLYNFMRLNGLKVNRHRYSLEIFKVGPTQTDNSKNYVTLVHLPIK